MSASAGQVEIHADIWAAPICEVNSTRLRIAAALIAAGIAPATERCALPRHVARQVTPGTLAIQPSEPAAKLVTRNGSASRRLRHCSWAVCRSRRVQDANQLVALGSKTQQGNGASAPMQPASGVGHSAGR